jgi:large subunit ribosomal protein L35
MSKLKSHRGAAKRFKRTGTGKFVRQKAKRRHILTSKPTQRKRHMRKSSIVTPGYAAKLKRMLPYD